MNGTIIGWDGMLDSTAAVSAAVLDYAGHIAIPDQNLVGLLVSLRNGLGLLGNGVTCGSSGADKDLQSRRQLGRLVRCSRYPVALCGDMTQEILVDFGGYILV